MVRVLGLGTCTQEGDGRGYKARNFRVGWVRFTEATGSGSKLRKEGQAVMEGGTRDLKVLTWRRHRPGTSGRVQGRSRGLLGGSAAVKTEVRPPFFFNQLN